MTYWKLQRKCITHTVDHPLVDKGDVVEEVEGGGGRPSSMRERCFNGTTFTNQYFECIRSIHRSYSCAFRTRNKILRPFCEKELVTRRVFVGYRHCRKIEFNQESERWWRRSRRRRHGLMYRIDTLTSKAKVDRQRRTDQSQFNLFATLTGDICACSRGTFTTFYRRHAYDK